MNEKLKKLVVKSDSLKLNDDMEAMIYGLSFKELAHLAQYQDSKDMEGAMTFILSTTLKKSFPELTEDELSSLLGSISGEVGFAIVNKVQELTGLGKTSEKN